MLKQPTTLERFLRERQRRNMSQSRVYQLSRFLLNQVANFDLSLQDALWIDQYTKSTMFFERQYKIKVAGLVILHSRRVLITREQANLDVWRGRNILTYSLSEGALAAMCMNLFAIEQIIGLSYAVTGWNIEALCSEKGLLAFRTGRVTWQHVTNLCAYDFRAYLAGINQDELARAWEVLSEPYLAQVAAIRI